MAHNFAIGTPFAMRRRQIVHGVCDKHFTEAASARPMPEGIWLGEDMDVLNASPWVCGFLFVQAIGLASAWLTRAGCSDRPRLIYGLFFCSLAAVGAMTLATCYLKAGGWYLSGTTLSLMCVAATFDRGRAAEAV